MKRTPYYRTVQKLKQIEKLKAEAAGGRQMDKLQKEKIAMEQSLREQLEGLTL